MNPGSPVAAEAGRRGGGTDQLMECLEVLLTETLQEAVDEGTRDQP